MASIKTSSAAERFLRELLTPEETAWLDAYHATVYQRLAPHLNDEERDWLREATSHL